MNSIKEITLSTSKYISLIIFLFAVLNFTQSDTFSDWDKDNNDELSKSEFQANFSTDHYSKWDTNNDQNLTQEEYYQATFAIMDEDKDKQLNTAEIDWGYERIYGDYVDYDVDIIEGENGSTIDYDQYREAVRDTRFYSDSDTDGDGNLTRDELSSSIFAILDWNDDGSLSRSEFGQFNRYNFGENKESKP